ncbi:MAG: zf-TFIIB domain-containing protein [Thermomicrobiales bacterium]
MKCPIDESELRITERQGIEIDYCPTCRGVWLDRGELDKIIERTAQTPSPDDRERYRDEPRPPRERYEEERYPPRRDDDDYRKKNRKRSMLEDLFDFD